MIDTSDLREYYLCDVAKELDRLYEVEKERDYYKERHNKLQRMYDALRRDYYEATAELQNDYDMLKWEYQDMGRTKNRHHPLDAPEKYLWVELNNWYDSCTIANNLEDAENAAKEDAITKKQATYIAAVVSRFEPVEQPYTRADY